MGLPGQELNTVDPPRRDMPILPSHGYQVFQMFTDNPGVWFFHCHLEFHAGLGMALAFIIGDKPEEPWLLQGATNNQVKQAEAGLCADIEFEGPIQFPSVGGGQEHCSETCEWDAIAESDSDDNPTPPTCGERITFLVNGGMSLADACTRLSTVEFPEICGGCVPSET